MIKGFTRKITGQVGGFVNLPRPLMANDLPLRKIPLRKSVFTPLAKSALLPCELLAAISAADAAIQKKIYESLTTALIISNEEMEDIMKIGKLLEELGLLLKGISEIIKYEEKEQKGRFLLMLLGRLNASILGNVLSGRGVIRASQEF